MSTVFRRAFALLAAVLATSATTVVVQASTSGAHFMNDTTDSVSSTGALVISIDEAGVGNQTVDYTVSTNATATYACINGGGNHPKAANKMTFQSRLSGGASFSPINGRVMASFSVGPLSAGGFTCPSGQTLVLASVSYSNVLLTDTTNSVSVTLPNRSATFFSV
jgi:hypothetical protein